MSQVKTGREELKRGEHLAALSEVKDALSEHQQMLFGEAQFNFESGENLREGLRVFKDLMRDANNEVAGLRVGNMIYPLAQLDRESVLESLRRSPHITPTVVCGGDLSIVSFSESNGYSENVYLGAQVVAKYESDDEGDKIAVFSGPVTRMDYEAFLHQVKELIVAPDSKPSSSLPGELVAEAKATREEFLKKSLSECSSILEQATRKPVGLRNCDDRNGYITTRVDFNVNIDEPGAKERFLNAINSGDKVIFGNSLTHRLRPGQSGSEEYFLGSVQIANCDTHPMVGEACWSIMGKPVPKEDFDRFIDQVKGLSGIDLKSELPAELKAELKRQG